MSPKFAERSTADHWAVCGIVALDTATVAIGDAVAFRHREGPITEPFAGFDPNRAVAFVTREDAEYPVEKLAEGTDVVGIRVELVNDVAQVPGRWVAISTISVEARFLVVADPSHVRAKQITDLLRSTTDSDINLAFTNGIIHGCAVRAAPGSWCLEVFKAADGNELGIRLLRLVGGAHRA